MCALDENKMAHIRRLDDSISTYNLGWFFIYLFS